LAQASLQHSSLPQVLRQAARAAPSAVRAGASEACVPGPPTMQAGLYLGAFGESICSLRGFQRVATAEETQEQATRFFTVGGSSRAPVPSARKAFRTEVAERPLPPPQSSPSSSSRMCGISLAAVVLASSSAAIAFFCLQAPGYWKRAIPSLALPREHLQEKSDSSKALHLHEDAPPGAVPRFRPLASGDCADRGYSAIRDFFTCRAASVALQSLEVSFPITWDERAGCHYWADRSMHRICSIPVSPVGSPAAAAVLDQASRTGGALRPASAAVGLPSPQAHVTAGATTARPPCGMMEEGIEYPGNDLYSVHASSSETCCQVCNSDRRCLLWTWNGPTSKVPGLCFLKGSRPRSVVTRLRNGDCVSGRAENGQGSVQVREARLGQSLFCFSLVLPFGYERSLLALQYRHHASIFCCDEYATYSNTSLEVAPAVVTGAILSDLLVQRGGEFGTVLNTDVFLAVWAKVVQNGRFLFHDWTVKADPDAVFIPSRLRALLEAHHESHRGTYLNNCKFGMHGPVEVFSRNAVKALGGGADHCMQHFIKLCSGKCQWGEDMFIDLCLKGVLLAHRENEYRLLLEDHCDPPAGWYSCQDTRAAAYHPFKTEEGYRRCLAAAEDHKANATSLPRHALHGP